MQQPGSQGPQGQQPYQQGPQQGQPYQQAPQGQQPYQQAPQGPNIHQFVTTTFDLPGYKVVRNFGVVRGIIVRSRSVVGNIGAGFQQIFGGNISIYTTLCEQARNDAYELMIQHAQQVGANGIIGVRYDATEISPGVTEVLCYGTAVVVANAQ